MTDAMPASRAAVARGFAVRRTGSAGGTVLRVSGEFDLTAVNHFEQAAGDIPPGTNVTVDLADLDFMDSSGLRALMNLDVRVGTGTRITLRAPQPHIRRLLQLCGFGERFEIVG